MSLSSYVAIVASLNPLRVKTVGHRVNKGTLVPMVTVIVFMQAGYGTLCPTFFTVNPAAMMCIGWAFPAWLSKTCGSALPSRIRVCSTPLIEASILTLLVPDALGCAWFVRFTDKWYG